MTFIVHPRTYREIRNLATLWVELGPRAARALFDDSFLAAAAQLIEWAR